MAYADHDRCTVNEAELTILELGARMRQRMEELNAIDARFRGGVGAVLAAVHQDDKADRILARCSEQIEKKRRDMASLQYMIDSIQADALPDRHVVSHLETLLM